MPRQDGRKPKKMCKGCGEYRHNVEKVSERIYPPNGADLCPDCLSLEIRHPSRVRVE